MHAKPPEPAEIERVSKLPADSPEWATLTLGLGIHTKPAVALRMLPAVQAAVRNHPWPGADYIAFIKTTAYKEAIPLEVHPLGSVEEVLKQFKRRATWLAHTGLPSGITWEDLRQAALEAYLRGAVKSWKDASKHMTDHIRSQRLHGTVMKNGRVLRKHRGITDIVLNYIPEKDEHVLVGVMLSDALRKMPRAIADALVYVEILGLTEAQTAKQLGVSQQAIAKRIAKIIPPRKVPVVKQKTPLPL